jgi:error-prone DNA polymerase
MIEHELALIAQLQYEPYFLTVADIVQLGAQPGHPVPGPRQRGQFGRLLLPGRDRGRPVRTTLLFERFISAERNEPPDIDIDFEHQRREEVIQYIYRKYGRHRAALTGVVISYRPRSALRDVGRALGIDLERIDAVAKGQHWWDPGPETPAASQGGGRLGAARRRPWPQLNPDRLRENGFDPDAPLCRLWVELTATLIGFPRHLSQHPGGFVIARDDLARLVPVENAAMEDRSVIQWDKDDLDALGLLKVDILALGMLSAIRRALGLVATSSACTAGNAPAAAGRRGQLRHAVPGRQRGHLPGRKPRPDEHAAAPEAALLLRPGDRGRHRAPRPHPGRHGAPLPAPPQRRRGGGLPQRRRSSRRWNARWACPSSRSR